MSLLMDSCSTPPLVRNLNNLAAFLKKGADNQKPGELIHQFS